MFIQRERKRVTDIDYRPILKDREKEGGRETQTQKEAYIETQRKS